MKYEDSHSEDHEEDMPRERQHQYLNLMGRPIAPEQVNWANAAIFLSILDLILWGLALATRAGVWFALAAFVGLITVVVMSQVKQKGR